MIAGLDEAGRGPLIGPMFMALCIVENEDKLKRIGVADSKMFGSSVSSRRKRKELFEKIRRVSQNYWVEIPASVIDSYVLKGPGLNRLECDAAEFLFSFLPSGVSITADGERIFSPLKKDFPELSTYNKADSLYPVVSAASIIAKNLRDEWMDNYTFKMKHLFGLEVKGGGYVNKSTLAFVSAFKDKFGLLPPNIRTSWKLKNQTLTIDFS